MFNIFAAARQGVNLSPAQRAFLRLVQGFAVAAITTAAVYVLQVAATQGTSVNLVLLGQYALGAFVVAFLLAVSKYERAHGDAPLADTLTTLAGNVQQFAGIPNDAKLEPTPMPDAPPSPPAASDPLADTVTPSAA